MGDKITSTRARQTKEAAPMADKPEPVKVGLVDPSIQHPWQTHEEYKTEQKRSHRLYLVSLA